jgi:glycosyltransferase involved in cell wall biosynthesis
MFPRISETFILREVQALRRGGVPLRLYSLMPPTRDRRIHPAARELLGEVDVLPQPGWKQVGAFFKELLCCLRLRPCVTGREVLRLLLRPHRRRWRKFFRAVSLAQRLRRDRIAHLHAAWAHTPASVALVACRLAGTPWSMGAHAKDIHLSHRTSLAKKLRSARYTLTCTRANQALLREVGMTAERDLPEPEVLLSYHGVNTTYFSPSENTEGPTAGAHAVPLILSVGRLVSKKGYDLLLRAAAQLRERGLAFRVEIVGDGPLRGTIESQITALGLSEVVKLRGMLVWEEVRKAYQRADCAVLASRITPEGDRDGIANTLAEAMACAVPVVASDMPSIRELITHRKTGLLVPSEDPAALADALEELLRQPALRRRLGRNARVSVRANFNEEDWGRRVARRLKMSLGIEKALYLTADRGVTVMGYKGASVHVRSVVSAFGELGARVRVMTTCPGPDQGPPVAAPLITCRTGDLRRRLTRWVAHWMRGGRPLERALLRLMDNVVVYRQIRRLARVWRPDFIYERYALTAFAGALLARRLRIPHVLEVNAPLAEEEARFRGLRLAVLARWMEGWLLRRADRLVVVSHALAAHARDLGVDPGRILVMANAVDTQLFNPQRDGALTRQRYQLNGQFVVGFSGTLKPWHGLHHLIRALGRHVPDRLAMHLLVVGDGPLRAELEDLVKELGLEGRVHFTGSVAHAEVPDLLSACDVLAAPYGPLEEFWFSPLKVAEYRALGRPVVASAIGQLEETLGEDQGVVLLPPGDEPALGRALSELADDSRRRRRLAHAAASTPPWTWRALARRVLGETEAARREIWGWGR